MKRHILFIMLVLVISTLQAQHQTDRWYFGINAGISFISGAPVVIPGSLNTTEGTTSSSDSLGNLNFYSDGVTVYDKNGTVMPNGSGLFGNVSTTVSALAVPHPGNADLHYLFTLDEATGTNGFCYSVVDMSLQSGNGDVTLKNIPIQGNVTEKMAAVEQLGTNNIWVTVHEWGTDAFYSYLVTPSGFQSTPVISHAGMIHTIDPLEQNKYGQMKFNSCGTKLALAIGYLDTVQVLDFDPATGMFSNPITLPMGDHVYGVEFSQNSSMLYATRYNTGSGYADLIQFDISSGNQATILSSMTVISSNTTGTSFYYALQMAPDNNIYLSVSWSPFLGKIDDPDVNGAGCNFTEMGFDLDPNFTGASSALGLPAFVQSYFRGEIICTVPSSLIEESNSDFHIISTISNEEFFVANENQNYPISILIFDNTGKLLESNNYILAQEFNFGKNLRSGMYFVRIQSKSKCENFKIVKI
ncbi:MAG TPA: T9SS type A sorting domain-containing protein [Bacteroidia bacterium]|nr:T9SS type A sorting domain-containing protein [Bacteroidia bacterium]